VDCARDLGGERGIEQRSGYVLVCDGHGRGQLWIMQWPPGGSFRLTVLPFNEGLHWYGPVRPAPIYSDDFGHNGGGTSSATHSPDSHGRAVGIDSMLLGPRTSVTSENIGSGTGSAQPAVSTLCSIIRRPLISL